MRWLLLVVLVACAHAQHADLVIEHGRVLTAQGPTDALAIRGTHVVAFGSEAKGMVAARRIDAGGRLVIAGIHDWHVHEPVLFDAHDVGGSETDDAPTTLSNLERGTHDVPRGTWLRAPLNVDADITQVALDRIAPEHPVWLDNGTGHVAVLNTAAERLLGLSSTPPPGGFIDKPGWRSEYARYEAMRKRAANATDAQIERALRQFEREALSFGITRVTTFPLDIDADLLAEELRVFGHKLVWHIVRVPIGGVEAPPIYRGGIVYGTKYFIDGMQVERGAALDEPYSDAPTSGRLDWARADIRRMLELSRQTNDRLHLHVVGDLAIDSVFAEMEALGGTWPNVVLEHAHLVDVARAKRLGVRVVSNPFHSEMSTINRARLGARVSRWMPIRSLVEAHVPFAFGSDGPLDPFFNLALAIRHPTNPGQAIDRDTAIAVYGLRLEIGGVADVAILTGDVEDPGTRSILTIVDGNVEYDASRASAASSARTE